MSDILHDFKRIRERYDELFREGIEKGQLPMRSTDFGFWGTASCFAVYDFFSKVELGKYSHFLDLGSGDGRVVLVASLFTRASGVEGDEELVRLSKEIRDELGLEADFHCKDYLKHDFSEHDFIFIYPDKAFTYNFEEKVQEEFKGDFYVYNQIYRPKKLQRGRTVWIDQMPVTRYKT